jgi:hypothetical protein
MQSLQGEKKMRNRPSLWLVVLVGFLAVAGCSKSGSSSDKPSSDNHSQHEKDLLAWGKGDLWLRAEDTDQMDGHKVVAYSTYPAGSDSTAAPILSVSCEPKWLAYLSTGPLENADVRVKFDDAPPVREQWLAGEHFLLPKSAETFVKRFVVSQTFKIEFTRLGHSAQVETYKIDNLKQLLAADNCKI